MKKYQRYEEKIDLGHGHLGNGITVWNRAKEIHGDYEKIAHIDVQRKITWYIKNPSKEIKDYVNKIIKGKNPNISAAQSQKVFAENKKFFESIHDKYLFKSVFMAGGSWIR